jgi:rhodanese-related sulfurtransferase
MSRSIDLKRHLFVFAIVASIAFFVANRSDKFNVRDVDAAAAKQLMDAGAVIIDVRGKEAFLDHHIAGALTMPLDELRTRVTAEKKTIALDRPIVIYCGDGARSGPEGTYVMNQAGYAGAVNLKGGLEGWQKAGLPMAAGA